MAAGRGEAQGRPWVELITHAEAHDVDRVLEHCHPDVAWETRWPGFESPFRGPDGVRRFFEAFEEAIADVRPSFRIVAEAGDRVLLDVVLTGHGRNSGAQVTMTVYDIWTFVDGLLLRRQTFYDRNEAIAELERCDVRPASAPSTREPAPGEVA